MRFIVLSSGSRQNCYYVESEDTAILIDMGISYPSLLRFLETSGLSLSKIKALAVTHEHQDHTNGMRSFLRNTGLPVFIHEKSRLFIDYRIKNYHDLEAWKGEKIGDLNITPFPVSHDAANTFGFIIEKDSKKIFMVSDVGVLEEAFYDLSANSDIIAVESNYDPDLLFKSKYPQYLKDRISGKKGHLSNPEACEFVRKSVCPRTKHIAFLHLSENSNSIPIVKQNVQDTLQEEFPLLNFHISRRDCPIPAIEI